MDKNYLLKKVINPRFRDYSYAITFFIIFSFSVYFLIRPTILSIVKSKVKVEELRKINDFYDTQVKKIIDLQTNLEAVRDDLHYVEEAIPIYPQVNKVFGDLKNTAAKNNLLIEKLNFDNINLTDNKVAKEAKKFELDLKAMGSFEDTKAFLEELTNQLRLKTVGEMSLTKESNVSASESSQLKIEILINSYYL
jgi:Tfp pilus assembly protein PilO